MLHKTSTGEIVEFIRAYHRQRVFVMAQRTGIYGRLGAHVRTLLGWRRDLPEKERKEIARRAAKIVADGTGEFAEFVIASRAAAEPFENIERVAIREITNYAQSLPVWATFGVPIRGFGAASLGIIVAEAGDLSLYPTHSKLWKRMGLAVIDGERQRKCANAEKALQHGYSPTRRSRMWNIGDALIKGNRDGKYRTLYLARKEFELARGSTKMHAHRRAQRYMEKRLLRDLWTAWRASTTQPIPAIKIVSAVQSS